MQYSYTPKNICASKIEVSLEDNLIKKVNVIGGCKGNKEALARLCVGRTPQEIITLLDGIQCRNGTSCPDQLAKMLKNIVEQ